MTIPLESIEVGKCYLMSTGGFHRVLRVVSITPSGHVVFEVRRHLHHHAVWMPEERGLRSFAAAIEREIPCDWSPNAEGGEP